MASFRISMAVWLTLRDNVFVSQGVPVLERKCFCLRTKTRVVPEWLFSSRKRIWSLPPALVSLKMGCILQQVNKSMIIFFPAFFLQFQHSIPSFLFTFLWSISACLYLPWIQLQQLCSYCFTVLYLVKSEHNRKQDRDWCAVWSEGSLFSFPKIMFHYKIKCIHSHHQKKSAEATLQSFFPNKAIKKLLQSNQIVINLSKKIPILYFPILFESPLIHFSCQTVKVHFNWKSYEYSFLF